MRKLTPEQKVLSVERRRQRQREYEARCRAADPEGYRRSVNEAGARWRRKHPERASERAMRWVRANRDQFNKTRRAWRVKNLLRALYINAKHSAKRRGIEFSIELSDLPPIGDRCPIFGHPFSAPTDCNKTFSASIDRIDSTLGYVPGNVWIISYRANTIKSDGTAEEHEMIARAMRAQAK